MLIRIDAYVQLLIKTCHRRGVAAMGGMAAQIPIKNDAAANDAAMEKVRQDKLREVKAGHDGTWVAHPALAKIALEIFDANMTGTSWLEQGAADSAGPNQYHVRRDEVNVSCVLYR